MLYCKINAYITYILKVFCIKVFLDTYHLKALH